MSKSFSELLKDDKPVLVDFYADWCAPCRMMKPVLEEVKKKVGDGATIIKIDVDRNPGVAGSYNVTGIPTLVIIKNGQLKWRQAGVVPSNVLVTELNKYINS